MKANAAVLEQAHQILRDGGVIAYPTESVIGLGCDAFNTEAVERVRALKKRNIEKGFIVLFDSLDRVLEVLPHLNDAQIEKLETHLGKPISWIVPNEKAFSYEVVGGRDTIAIRITEHPICKGLCQHLQSPIISTSANISNQTSSLTMAEAKKTFGANVDMYVPGELGKLGKPTEIRHIDTDQILRDH